MSDLSALPPAVRAYVQEFALRGRRLAVLRAAGVAAAVFLAWSLLCCVADRFAQFPPWARLAMLGGGAVAASALLLGPVLRAIRREDDWVVVAERIERQNPRFGQRLVTVTSRLLGRPEYRGSDEILEHLVYELDRQAAGENASRLLPVRSAVAAWCAVLLAAAGALALARVPDFNLPRLAHRFFVPLADVAPVTTTRVAVSPGDRDVPQGAPLTIEATAERLGDSTVWLFLSDDGVTWSRSNMTWAGDGHYTYGLPSVERDQWYYVSGGDAATRRYAIRVLRRPAIAEFRIHYVYPAYTGRPPQTVANSDGVIEAPVGTEVTVTIIATEPLQSALLTANGEKILMSRAATEAPDNATNAAGGAKAAENVRQARFKVVKQGPYQVDLITTREQAGSGPPSMFVRAVPDRAPVTRLPATADNVRAGPRDIIPIPYEAIDDYGLDSIGLRAQAAAGPPVDVPVESFAPRRSDAGTAPATATADEIGAMADWADWADWADAPAPKRREGVVHVDLATMPLTVGDVLTLTLTARDTAGNAAQGTPVRVLIAPRMVDFRTGERIGETEAAAQWSDALAGEIEAAVKALEEVSAEAPATVGGMPGSGGSQPSGAAGRVNRRLASAIESGAALRRALLRATARAEGPQFSVATAGWLDAAQAISSTLQSVFRAGTDTTTERSAAAEPLRQVLQRARDLRTDLATVARGLRAEALIADRENLAAAAKRPSPKDPKAAELLSKTLDGLREHIAAGARVLGLDPGAGDVGAKLKGLAEAARSLTASRRPVDFAAASRAWADGLKRDPVHADGLDERLTSAAQQEAVRPDADLVRARDLQLAARAAARLAGMAARAARPAAGPAADGSSTTAPAARREMDEFARAIAAVQREHRRGPDGSTRVGERSSGADNKGDADDDDEAAHIRAAAEQARGVLATFAGEQALTSAIAAPRAPSKSPAAPSAARAEALAFAAGARLAAHEYPVATELDRAFSRQLAAYFAEAGGRPPASNPVDATLPAATTDVAHLSIPVEQQAEQRRAEIERAGKNVRRLTAAAEQIDAIAGKQQRLIGDTRVAADKGADEKLASSLAGRQHDLASQITERIRQANPLSEPGTVSLATTQPAPDDANSRERPAAALAAAGQQLAAMPPLTAASAQALADSLRPYAPETSGAQDVVSTRLMPALEALEALASAVKSPDGGAVDRAAGQARQAVQAAQAEIDRAEDAIAERDPLVAAKCFARAAADALSRQPPDLRSAQRYQDRTARALARSWDVSIHRAAAQRLAVLPSMRPLITLVPPADVLSADAPPMARTGANPAATGSAAHEWRRLRPRDSDDAAASFRDSAPPEYEAALDLYFKALNKGREGGK